MKAWAESSYPVGAGCSQHPPALCCVPEHSAQPDRETESVRADITLYIHGVRACATLKLSRKSSGKEERKMRQGKTPSSCSQRLRGVEKVGLICHNRSRSKWKDDPSIWPTALSFIALTLSKSFPLRGFGCHKVLDCSENNSNLQITTMTKAVMEKKQNYKKMFPKLAYKLKTNSDTVGRDAYHVAVLWAWLCPRVLNMSCVIFLLSL